MVSAWSIGKSQRGGITKNDTPGPGSYTPHQHHNNTPNSWKIGTENTRSRQYGNNNMPGPAQYNPGLSKTQTLRKFPQYVFGVKNYKYKFNDTPGPGQYAQSENKIRQAQPQYTFGMKTGSSLGNKNSKFQPSPADYNINRDDNMTQRPSSKIGNANRSNLYYTGDTPGVGNYELRHKYAGPKYTFGTSGRSTSAKTLNGGVPGPASYQTKSTLNQTSRTMGQKLQQGGGLKSATSRDDPGPQDYSVNVNLVKRGQPGIKIGREQRNQITKESLYKPSPNQYRPSTVDKKRQATYKIGTETRGKILNQDNPGPGTYSLGTTIGTGKKYPIGEKINQKQKDYQPGPADYAQDPKITKTRPASCKIGSSNRTRFDAGDVPGPSAYYTNEKKIGPYISFGRELRGNFGQHDTPGPGTYQLEPTFADVPDYLIQNQRKLMV